eukprot:2688322-Amphidinium_carterae.1
MVLIAIAQRTQTAIDLHLARLLALPIVSSYSLLGGTEEQRIKLDCRFSDLPQDQKQVDCTDLERMEVGACARYCQDPQTIQTCHLRAATQSGHGRTSCKVVDSPSIDCASNSQQARYSQCITRQWVKELVDLAHTLKSTPAAEVVYILRCMAKRLPS